MQGALQAERTRRCVFCHADRPRERGGAFVVKGGLLRMGIVQGRLRTVPIAFPRERLGSLKSMDVGMDGPVGRSMA